MMDVRSVGYIPKTRFFFEVCVKFAIVFALKQ